MSDKASSDLDVFDGLAAKKSRPSVPAGPGTRGPVPPPSPSATRQKTLLGLATPGAPPPPPMPSKVPPPPPPPGARSSIPAPPPPPAKTAPGGFPPPPGTADGSSPPPGLATPAPPPPPGAVAGISSSLPAPPPPPPPALNFDARANPEESTPAPLPPVPSKVPPAPPAPVISRPPVAPPPAPVLSQPVKTGVDVDWDDEDEATTVFDKGQEDASRALLHSAPAVVNTPPGAVPAPAARALVSRPLSMPPPSMPPRAPLPPPPSVAPSPLQTTTVNRSAASATAVPSFEPPVAAPEFRGSSTGSKGLFFAIAALLVVGAGVGAYVLVPKKGSLVVSVAGPGNKAIDAVEVYVDGTKRCDSSPCQVTDLPRGVHFVKVAAAGYQTTAPKAVKINAGEEAAENVDLVRASDGTGLKVLAEGAGLKLSLDGKEIGPLPQEIKDLEPGEHVVRIDGGDRYESFEKRVSVEADKMLTLEPKLKVKKGLATIKAGANADGAKVMLVSGSERRPVPSLPLRVDITSEKPYSIVASKKGYEDYNANIVFEDGQAERTFVVELSEKGSSSSASEAASTSDTSSSSSKASSVPAFAAAAAPKPVAAAKPAGGATLNINSIPVSNVILDGRPLGQTPKVGVSVSPGSHTVIFVHPEHGRKSKSVTVEAGKSATAAVRFP